MPPRYSTFKTFLFSSSFILVRDVIFVFVNDETNVSLVAIHTLAILKAKETQR